MIILSSFFLIILLSANWVIQKKGNFKSYSDFELTFYDREPHDDYVWKRFKNNHINNDNLNGDILIIGDSFAADLTNIFF